MLFHGLPPWYWLCVGVESTPSITLVCKDSRSFFSRGTGLASAKAFLARMGPGWLVGARETFARVHSVFFPLRPVFTCQP
jgi:hypothetical protein